MECVSEEVESTGTLITKYIIYAKTIQGLHLYLVKHLDGDLMECVSDQVESTGTLITKYNIRKNHTRLTLISCLTFRW